MNIKPHHQVAAWLIVSAVLLAALIPGGPIENRDFSHIHAGILAGFNLFLTTLDFCSVVLAYFIFRRPGHARKFAYGIAAAYLGVYALDLARVFPASPTAMSFSLALVEVLGIGAALKLIFATHRAGLAYDHRADSPGSQRVSYAVIFALVIAGISIVLLATDAAIHHSSISLIVLEPTTR